MKIEINWNKLEEKKYHLSTIDLLIFEILLILWSIFSYYANRLGF